jgi:hypothetical protein
MHQRASIKGWRKSFGILFFLAVISYGVLANAPVPGVKPSERMPAEIGQFKLSGEAKESAALPYESPLRELRTSSHLLSTAEGRYVSPEGAQLSVAVFKWDSDSAAFADVTQWSRLNQKQLDSGPARIGTASARIDRAVKFYEGPISVAVTNLDQSKPDRTSDFARDFAMTLDKSTDEIPVLVKHLPNWETVQRTTIYIVDPADLISAIPNQPVLNEVSFEGGTEAVTASYGASQLVIVEFTTPQLSIDNDSRIWTKLAELKSKGQPTPTAYRRVGNYSVFVFNAPDEKTANALVDQVKYEQVVQWLGEDPHLYERLQKYFTQTSAGVLVAVLKSSGLSLILCLVAGALIGTMMFRHRRTQKATMYSDAGGSIRLNLDDLTGPANAGRLLKNANSSEQNSSNS